MARFDLKTTALAGALALTLSGAAQAAPVLSQPFSDLAGFNAFTAQPGVSEVFVAQGRIGNAAVNGTYEIGLHTPPNFTNAAEVAPTNPGGTTQFAWGNTQPVAFTLARTGTTITFSMGNYVASYMAAAVGEVSTLVLRLAATATSTVTLSNLNLGGPLGGVSRTAGSEYWVISPVDGGDFSLTGNATMSWTGNAPTNSALSFQIKGFVAPVPEPASLVLLGAGLIGLGFAARRRRV